MSLDFGTDGIRGVANQELTPELSLALGRAAALVLGGGSEFIIGRDSRASGPMLQAALAAGLASEGCHVIDVGVLPTPAVAFLSVCRNAPAAMISASHNPFADNGIKFFLAGGRKLSDAIEEELSGALARLDGSPSGERPSGAGVGSLDVDVNAVLSYEEHLRAAVRGADLSGSRIVLDCANGAASAVAPRVFRSLGAEAVVLADQPDGTNINDACGSTHPEMLQHAVREHAADMGFAFDGDADRVIAVDADGTIVDGDHLLALHAADAHARGRLSDGTVVATVMSNLGFRRAMEQRGVTVHETQVGDRYVLEALTEHGWSLGGEQSGHIIFADVATTGDGVLAALRTAALVRRERATLRELASVMSTYPQVLRNVRVENKHALYDAEVIWAAVRAAEAALGQDGRVLVRPSGTEPLVRVMVEAPTEGLAAQVAADVARVVEGALAARTPLGTVPAPPQ